MCHRAGAAIYCHNMQDSFLVSVTIFFYFWTYFFLKSHKAILEMYLLHVFVKHSQQLQCQCFFIQ